MKKLHRWVLLSLLGFSSASTGADRTWTNASGNFTWDVTSNNWSGSPETWSNTGDAAIFAAAGVGTVNVVGTVQVRSFDFQNAGYTVAGGGNLVITSAGAGTQPASALNVASGVSAVINAPLSSSIGLYKSGAGTLQLGGTVTFTGAGTTPIIADAVNLQIGLTNSGMSGFPVGGAGTIELTAANVLPANSSVAIGNGWLNIGNNTVTLGRLVYMNTVASSTAGNYGPNGNNGVYGTGTLRVNGPIIVQGNLGQSGFSNTLAANLDMQGGTQSFFVGTVPTGLGYTGLHITGVLSNGSLFKSQTSAQAGGIALFGNNTYTGATVINGSTLSPTFTTNPLSNVASGTNASTSLTLVSAAMSLFGANGSFGSATNVTINAGSVLSLDNVSSTNGSNSPLVAAGNNINRLANAANVVLSHGTLQLVGFSGGNSSQSVASVQSLVGFNTLTATATAGGTATLEVAGNLTVSPRSTMQLRGTTLGSSSLIFVNGTAPAANGGIIPMIYGVNTAPAETGFVRYETANGFVLLAAGDYQTAFGSGGNVTIAANPAANLNTQTINSLRTTAAATIAFNPGAVLTVSTGQILNTSGTLTIDATTPAGTLAFAATPATFHAISTVTVNSPITGTAGLIKTASGTLNLNGSLAGLSGTLTHNLGTTSLAVPYTDNIDILNGTFNLRANLTTPGRTITLGNPNTPNNTVGGNVGLNIQSVNVTQIAANLVVSNGSTDPTFTLASINQQGGNNGITQEFSGTLTLNSTLNILGGGNTTNTILFSNTITGAGGFRIQNGTIRLTGNYSNYTGPIVIGNGGNTTLFTFDGVGANATGTLLIGSGSGPVTSTVIRVSSGTGVPAGLITQQGGTLQPTTSLTLGNNFLISGNAAWEVPNAGQVVAASGQLTSSGTTIPTLTKTGPGLWNLTGNSPAYAGNLGVSAGTLGILANVSAAAVTVATGGTLQGNGTLNAPVTVNSGGAIKGGNSIGTLTINANTALTAAASNGSTLRVEGNTTANSRIVVTGANTFNLASLTGTNVFTIQILAPGLVQNTPYSWELVSTPNNTSGVLVNAVVATGSPIPVSNYIVTSPDFSQFLNVSLIANGNSLVLNFTPVPEPISILGCLSFFGAFACRRKKRYGA